MVMLTSVTTLGTGNGIIKYVAEYKNDQPALKKLFSSTFLLVSIGSFVAFFVLLFFSESISEYLFGTETFSFVVKILAVAVPFVAMHRIFNCVISGLSDYKSYAKIDLFGYLLAALLLVIGLYLKSISGVLIAISVAPVLQLLVLFVVFGRTLLSYVDFKGLTWSRSFAKPLLAFTLMSFVSTFLLNSVELDIRTQISNRINIEEAGYWTALTFISKNYMVFISGVLSLYVLPKFAEIKLKDEFIKEVIYVFKSILPLFAVGMLLIYLFRDVIINLIYPDFTGMSILFKWQLLGDLYQAYFYDFSLSVFGKKNG